MFLSALLLMISALISGVVGFSDNASPTQHYVAKLICYTSISLCLILIVTLILQSSPPIPHEPMPG